MVGFLTSLMVERNAGQRLAYQVQYPIRDNRADLRPRASDHAGKHFDVKHTCQAQVGLYMYICNS